MISEPSLPGNYYDIWREQLLSSNYKVALIIYNTETYLASQETLMFFVQSHQAIALMSHYFHLRVVNQIIYNIVPFHFPSPSVPHFTKQSLSDRIFPCLETPRAKHVV